jgi:hypothetical protein
LPQNPFNKLLGIPEKQQRATGLIVGVGFCLLGLFMLLQGLGILSSNTN